MACAVFFSSHKYSIDTTSHSITGSNPNFVFSLIEIRSPHKEMLNLDGE